MTQVPEAVAALGIAARLTAQLNLLWHNPQHPTSAEVAAQLLVAAMPNHVVDPRGLLGLDSFNANPLDRAMEVVGLFAPGPWVLAVAQPGRLGVLRGPTELNQAATDANMAVVSASGAVAFVPWLVGSSVQWEVLPANRPTHPLSLAEAQRDLAESMLIAEAELKRVGGAQGESPGLVRDLLPSHYPQRNRQLADRAASVLVGVHAALAQLQEGVSSHEITTREHQLRQLRDSAVDALAAATVWPGD